MSICLTQLQKLVKSLQVKGIFRTVIQISWHYKSNLIAVFKMPHLNINTSRSDIYLCINLYYIFLFNIDVYVKDATFKC